jgi:membrane-bound lytic murein transglycosylase A
MMSMIRRTPCLVLGLVYLLIACAGPGAAAQPEAAEAVTQIIDPSPAPKLESTQSALPPMAMPGSRWVTARWDQLPGWSDDDLVEAWNAWLRNCSTNSTNSKKIHAALLALCPQLRALSLSSNEERRAWMQERFQPWRVLTPEASDIKGLLTGYYEPLIEASLQATERFSVPLYAPPPNMNVGKAWYSRQEIDTSPQAKAALAGRTLLYVADPLQALVVQIQGSARVRVVDGLKDATTDATNADSNSNTSPRLLRLAYAGNNGHPYRSVGSWLLAQGALRDASWQGIAAWAAANPTRVNEMLWANPRVVFFKFESDQDLSAQNDLQTGPRGAQGVPLTAGRSIAIDPRSMPYGSPVWLASEGSAQSSIPKLQRLVFAQDTGSAIVGAVRADYFVGTGAAAGELAGRLKQGLTLWVLWPKQP